MAGPLDGITVNTNIDPDNLATQTAGKIGDELNGIHKKQKKELEEQIKLLNNSQKSILNSLAEVVSGLESLREATTEAQAYEENKDNEESSDIDKANAKKKGKWTLSEVSKLPDFAAGPALLLNEQLKDTNKLLAGCYAALDLSLFDSQLHIRKAIEDQDATSKSIFEQLGDFKTSVLEGFSTGSSYLDVISDALNNIELQGKPGQDQEDPSFLRLADHMSNEKTNAVNEITEKINGIISPLTGPLTDLGKKLDILQGNPETKKIFEDELFEKLEDIITTLKTNESTGKEKKKDKDESTPSDPGKLEGLKSVIKSAQVVLVGVLVLQSLLLLVKLGPEDTRLKGIKSFLDDLLSMAEAWDDTKLEVIEKFKKATIQIAVSFVLVSAMVYMSIPVGLLALLALKVIGNLGRFFTAVYDIGKEVDSQDFTDQITAFGNAAHLIGKGLVSVMVAMVMLSFIAIAAIPAIIGLLIVKGFFFLASIIGIGLQLPSTQFALKGIGKGAILLIGGFLLFAVTLILLTRFIGPMMGSAIYETLLVLGFFAGFILFGALLGRIGNKELGEFAKGSILLTVALLLFCVTLVLIVYVISPLILRPEAMASVLVITAMFFGFVILGAFVGKKLPDLFKFALGSILLAVALILFGIALIFLVAVGKIIMANIGPLIVSFVVIALIFVAAFFAGQAALYALVPLAILAVASLLLFLSMLFVFLAVTLLVAVGNFVVKNFGPMMAALGTLVIIFLGFTLVGIAAAMAIIPLGFLMVASVLMLTAMLAIWGSLGILVQITKLNPSPLLTAKLVATLAILFAGFGAIGFTALLAMPGIIAVAATVGLILSVVTSVVSIYAALEKIRDIQEKNDKDKIKESFAAIKEIVVQLKELGQNIEGPAKGAKQQFTEVIFPLVETIDKIVDVVIKLSRFSTPEGQELITNAIDSITKISQETLPKIITILKNNLTNVNLTAKNLRAAQALEPLTKAIDTIVDIIIKINKDAQYASMTETVKSIINSAGLVIESLVDLADRMKKGGRFTKSTADQVDLATQIIQKMGNQMDAILAIYDKFKNITPDEAEAVSTTILEIRKLIENLNKIVMATSILNMAEVDASKKIIDALAPIMRDLIKIHLSALELTNGEQASANLKSASEYLVVLGSLLKIITKLEKFDPARSAQFAVNAIALLKEISKINDQALQMTGGKEAAENLRDSLHVITNSLLLAGLTLLTPLPLLAISTLKAIGISFFLGSVVDIYTKAEKLVNGKRLADSITDAIGTILVIDSLISAINKIGLFNILAAKNTSAELISVLENLAQANEMTEAFNSIQVSIEKSIIEPLNRLDEPISKLRLLGVEIQNVNTALSRLARENAKTLSSMGGSGGGGTAVFSLKNNNSYSGQSGGSSGPGGSIQAEMEFRENISKVQKDVEKLRKKFVDPTESIWSKVGDTITGVGETIWNATGGRIFGGNR